MTAARSTLASMRSADLKVAALAARVASGVKPRTSSAWGLPAGLPELGGSCPGATGLTADHVEAEHLVHGLLEAVGAAEAVRAITAARRGAAWPRLDASRQVLDLARDLATTCQAVPEVAAEVEAAQVLDCRDCYAEAVAVRRGDNVRGALARNLEAWRAWRADGTLADQVAGFLHQVHAQHARRGLTMPARGFWSGDLEALADAQAVAQGARQYAQAVAWSPTDGPVLYLYTRTLEALPGLAQVARLGLVTVYASADAWNARQVRAAVARRPWCHVAPLARHQVTAEALGRWIRPGARPLACPENAGRLPLAVAAGRRPLAQAEVGTVGRGACAACMACPLGTRDVVAFHARPGAPS